MGLLPTHDVGKWYVYYGIAEGVWTIFVSDSWLVAQGPQKWEWRCSSLSHGTIMEVRAEFVNCGDVCTQMNIGGSMSPVKGQTDFEASILYSL